MHYRVENNQFVKVQMVTGAITATLLLNLNIFCGRACNLRRKNEQNMTASCLPVSYSRRLSIPQSSIYELHSIYKNK